MKVDMSQIRENLKHVEFHVSNTIPGKCFTCVSKDPNDVIIACGMAASLDRKEFSYELGVYHAVRHTVDETFKAMLTTQAIKLGEGHGYTDYSDLNLVDSLTIHNSREAAKTFVIYAGDVWVFDLRTDTMRPAGKTIEEIAKLELNAIKFNGRRVITKNYAVEMIKEYTAHKPDENLTCE